MAFGVTGSGFSIKPLDDIKTALETALKAKFGAQIDVTPSSNWGQVIGVFAEVFADLWELGQDVYSAGTRSGAESISLDYVGALTGTRRAEATNSTVTVSCTGTNGTVLEIGRIVSVESSGTQFVSTEEKTITSVGDWAYSTHYAVGDRVTNVGNVYQAINAGYALGTGPTGTDLAIGDGPQLVWRYVGVGAAVVDVPFEAADDGPIAANAETLNVIVTPVSGWNNAVNIEDADLGSARETDAAYRVRQEEELDAQGSSTVDTILARLLEVTDVTAANVYENTSMVTDADGVPAKALECVVIGGTDVAVATCIWDNKGGGIRAFGQGSVVTESITDSQGIAHSVSFTRPTEIPIWITINVTVDADTFPEDGDTAIKTAIATWGDTFKMGRNVTASGVGSQAFQVAGVLDTTAVYVGTSYPAGASTTIAVSLREIATFDTGRITVNVTEGTP